MVDRETEGGGQVKLYQQLQILNLQFNDCFSQLGMPYFVFQNLMTHSILLYIPLKLHDVYPTDSDPRNIHDLVNQLVLFGGCNLHSTGRCELQFQGFCQVLDSCFGSQGPEKVKAYIPPLGAKFSSFYTIHRTKVLFIFLSVINLTVQAMLLD